MKHRRRHRNKKKARAAEGVPETSVDDVPDDLLERILLHLDSPSYLIRAASTCKRWRGVVVAGDGGGAFLRRALWLHPPTVAGHYHTPVHWNSPIEFIPTWSPVLPIADSRFSLGKFSKWQVTDIHAGLVLLQQCGLSLNLVVYDPLTRLSNTTSIAAFSVLKDGFLLDGEDGNISASNYRVLCRFYDGHSARVLSDTNGTESEDWRFLPGASRVNATIDQFQTKGQFAGRVDGSLNMGSPSGGMTVLDKASLEVSMVDLPSRVKTEYVHGISKFLVVHCAGEDSTSLLALRIVHARNEELEIFRHVHNGGADEWVLENSIRRLSEATRGLPSCPEKDCWVCDVVTQLPPPRPLVSPTNNRRPATTTTGCSRRRHLRSSSCPPRPSIKFVPTSPPPLVPIDTSCFSLDFLLHLGKTFHLEVADCHGGLVLLQRLSPSLLVVCDPLTCRYRKVNITREQIMGDLFLLDGEDGTISSSNFRVFLYDEPRSSVFSTTNGGNRWRSMPPPKDDLETEGPASFAGRVEGSLYMGTESGTVLVLDNTTLELNKAHLASRVKPSTR